MASSNVTRKWLVAYVITLTVITTLFLAIRILVRLRPGTAKFGLDDIFIILSWMFSVGITGLSIVGSMDHDFSRHLADIPQEVVGTTVEIAWVLNILYLAQTTFLKISILTLYRRASKGAHSPRFKWAIWALITFVVVYNVIIFILYLIQCIPIAAIWMLFNNSYASTAKSYCVSNTQNIIVAWLAGVLAICTDFLTIILPSWIFFQPDVAKRGKIALAIVICVGSLVIIPSAFRLRFLVKAESLHADVTWNYFNANVAGKAEGDFGIICACAPCLGVMFGRLFEDRERDRSPAQGGSRPPSRSSKRAHSRSRSRDPSTSRQSMRSIPIGRTGAPSPSPGPGRDVEHAAFSDARRVLQWNSDSLSYIPEAYPEDGRRKTVPRRKELISEDYGGRKSATPIPSRPDTSQSWLDIDGNSSSGDEAELTIQWYKKGELEGATCE